MNKEQLILHAKRKIAERREKAVDDCQKTLQALRSHDDWKSCEHVLKTAQVRFVLSGD